MMKSLNYTECIINYAGYVEYLDMINGVVAGLEEEERRRKAEEERRRQIEEERRHKAEEERRRQIEEERRRKAEEERRRQAEEERRQQAEEERRRQAEEERRRQAEEERRRQAEEERRRQAEEERRRQAEEERKYLEDIERIRAFAENLPRFGQDKQKEMMLFSSIQTKRGNVLYDEVMKICKIYYDIWNNWVYKSFLSVVSICAESMFVSLLLSILLGIIEEYFFDLKRFFDLNDKMYTYGLVLTFTYFFIFILLKLIIMLIDKFVILKLNNYTNQLIKANNIKFKLESGSKKD